VRLWCIVKYKIFHALRSYLRFESPNGQSKLLNMISISKYHWRSKFLFIFIYLFYFLDGQKITSIGWCRNSLINKICTHINNSKIFKKNIKFDLQQYFNMEIIYVGTLILFYVLDDLYHFVP
jgi:hypothetical protein